MTILISALLPALIVALVFYLLDRNKEPLGPMIRAFLLGCLASVLVDVLHLALRLPGALLDGTVRSSLSTAFVAAGFMEEMVKLAVLAVVCFWKDFDEWYDGILYGVLIGLGFAFVENLLYFFTFLQSDGFGLVLRRSVLCMPMHALACGMMGFFLARAKFSPARRRAPLLVLAGLSSAVLVHGLYDFVLMASQLHVQWLAAGIVTAAWFGVLRMKRTSQTTIREQA